MGFFSFISNRKNRNHQVNPEMWIEPSLTSQDKNDNHYLINVFLLKIFIQLNALYPLFCLIKESFLLYMIQGTSTWCLLSGKLFGIMIKIMIFYFYISISREKVYIFSKKVISILMITIYN